VCLSCGSCLFAYHWWTTNNGSWCSEHLIYFETWTRGALTADNLLHISAVIFWRTHVNEDTCLFWHIWQQIGLTFLSWFAARVSFSELFVRVCFLCVCSTILSVSVKLWWLMVPYTRLCLFSMISRGCLPGCCWKPSGNVDIIPKM